MVDVVQLVEHRIVVPSVVGSSPIIHPKSLALPARFFLWVDDGTLGGQGRLFLCPSPYPLPSGGAAADAAGAFGLATPHTWPLPARFFCGWMMGLWAAKAAFFYTPPPAPSHREGPPQMRRGPLALPPQKPGPSGQVFFVGGDDGTLGGRRVRTASCSRGGGGGGCGGCFPSRLLSRQRK